MNLFEEIKFLVEYTDYSKIARFLSKDEAKKYATLKFYKSHRKWKDLIPKRLLTLIKGYSDEDYIETGNKLDCYPDIDENEERYLNDTKYLASIV